MKLNEITEIQNRYKVEMMEGLNPGVFHCQKWDEYGVQWKPSEENYFKEKGVIIMIK